MSKINTSEWDEAKNEDKFDLHHFEDFWVEDPDIGDHICSDPFNCEGNTYIGVYLHHLE